MFRTDIINTFAALNNAKSYLEIGVQRADLNFNKIIIPADPNGDKGKVGVDPDPKAGEGMGINEFFNMTSDIFFQRLYSAVKPGGQYSFDIVFVDGLHFAENAKRDVIHALPFLAPNGVIIMHDCSPIKEEHQTVKRTTGIWNGDVWKAFVQLRIERPDLEMYTVDTDYGCGIIRKATEPTVPLFLKHDMNWQGLVQNRKEWLNLISVEEFNAKIEEYKAV